MVGCCSGSGGSTIIQAKRDLDGLGGNGNMNAQIDPNAEMVRMEYFGPRIGAVTYHGKRRHYRFGNNAIDRYNDVNSEDVETLLSQPGFRMIGKDAQDYSSPGVDFVPEPAGEFVPEIAPDVVPDAVQEVVIPEPAGESTRLEGDYWEDETSLVESPDEGAPPALDIEPLPGTVKEIKSAVMGADLDTLLAWLREEQNEKKRKTALEAIEGALEDR